MESSEMRVIGRLREIGDLIAKVCDMSQAKATMANIAELKAGYYKARLWSNNALASILGEQIRHALDGDEFSALDDLYESDRISIAELAFCRCFVTDKDA